MKTADKLCYPIFSSDGFCSHEKILEPEDIRGLTFRERLIIALASNPEIINYIPDSDSDCIINTTRNAKKIINQADAIIKQLEEN